MRFLADESCDFAVVRALRAAGHEVVAVAEGALRGSSDVEVIALAKDNRRILVPEVLDLVASPGETLYGIFAVIEPGRVRISRIA